MEKLYEKICVYFHYNFLGGIGFSSCCLTGQRRELSTFLDKSQRSKKYTSATFLTHAGIPTYIDGKHAIAHNKIMIIDKATVITGSFNFTKAAEEKNAENILIISSKELARLYMENWQKHGEHSEGLRRE